MGSRSSGNLDIDCKDFQFFTRGIARQEVLGYIFKWVPLASVRDIIHTDVGDPADKFCVRLTATYTAGKALCEDFYGRF